MKKLTNSKGLTFVELLAATLIMLLVSMGLVTGIALSNKEFILSVKQSEAQELYSTLSSLITNELRYTTELTYKENNEVETFYSVTFAIRDAATSLVSLNENDKETTDYGYLALGNSGDYNKLLGDASYPNSLGAKCKVYYNQTGNYFTVELDIGTIKGDSIYSNSFVVRSVNEISVK